MMQGDSCFPGNRHSSVCLSERRKREKDLGVCASVRCAPGTFIYLCGIEEGGYAYARLL